MAGEPPVTVVPMAVAAVYTVPIDRGDPVPIDRGDPATWTDCGSGPGHARAECAGTRPDASASPAPTAHADPAGRDILARFIHPEATGRLVLLAFRQGRGLLGLCHDLGELILGQGGRNEPLELV